MSHELIILESIVASPPPAGASIPATDEQMKVRIEYTPPHGATPAQIAQVVARTVKRTRKLLDSQSHDDDPHE